MSKTKAKLPYKLPCPKCGSSDVHHRYHAESDEWDRSYYNRAYRGVIGNVSYVGFLCKAMNECLTHFCRSCEYEWNTDVKQEAK